MKKKILLAIVAALLIASPVMAKEGFYVGAFIPSTSISGDAGAGISSATGLGFRIGNGLNRYLSIEGDYSKTTHNSVDLTGLAVDLKLNFPLTSLDSAQVMTVEPYVFIGYDYFDLATTPAIKSNGVQYGFGIELYLFRELSVQAGWTKSPVSFDSTPKRDGTVTTLDLGIIYHFI